MMGHQRRRSLEFLPLWTSREVCMFHPARLVGQPPSFSGFTPRQHINRRRMYKVQRNRRVANPSETCWTEWRKLIVYRDSTTAHTRNGAPLPTSLIPSPPLTLLRG